MEIDSYILGREGQKLVKTEFDIAMAKAASEEFIDKPKSLLKTKKLRSSSFAVIKDNANKVREKIIKRKELFQDAGLNNLDASDYSVRSIMTEERLNESGAVYGDKAYNFCLDTLKIPNLDLKEVERVAQVGFNNVFACKTSNSSKNTTEEYLDGLDLKPNGARVDIILTSGGPKIIEINYQWVDGIQALEAFQNTLLGPKKPYPSDQFAQIFRDKRSLGIILLNSASGSREQGELKSLQIMANNLMAKGLFAKVEILNPDVVRPDYIAKFKSLYINGDPKMIPGADIPEWLLTVYEQAKNPNFGIFPYWNPKIDKKSVLVEASERWPEIFAETYNFRDASYLGASTVTPNWVIKGDAFSSRQVAISGTQLFENIFSDAVQFPNEYVLQPKLQSSSIPPTWAYDTSSDKPVYIERPNCKLNVWVINNKVVGTMASISGEEIISDKDFNTIPIPC